MRFFLLSVFFMFETVIESKMANCRMPQTQQQRMKKKSPNTVSNNCFWMDIRCVSHLFTCHFFRLSLLLVFLLYKFTALFPRCDYTLTHSWHCALIFCCHSSNCSQFKFRYDGDDATPTFNVKSIKTAHTPHEAYTNENKRADKTSSKSRIKFLDYEMANRLFRMIRANQSN